MDLISCKDTRLVIIDVDNTILSTATRKYRLLNERFKINCDFETVRSDYNLLSVFGADTALARQFFECLDTSEAITSYPAPAFPGASEVIKAFRAMELSIYYLTGRPSITRDATVKELETYHLWDEADTLLMPDLCNSPHTELNRISARYKRDVIHQLIEQCDVIAVIGDRPEDLNPALESGIPVILVPNTLTKDEISGLQKMWDAPFPVIDSWAEIATTIDEYRTGSLQMAKLREIFTTQYSGWLKDSDEKLKAVVTISALISAFTGTQLKGAPLDDKWLLVSALALSTISVIYAIRGLTSRHTSGLHAADAITALPRQWIAILIGRPKKWLHLPGDPIAEFQNLTNASKWKKETAHLTFFFNKYNTHSAKALMNLRLFELRAANYSKIYAERIASKLLVLAIVVLLAWEIKGLF